MPLARIITDSVDESLELTMQLRSRGFQVETVSPGQVPTTPADLEVRLEECDSAEVLARTASSEEDDLWVFIAPGALDDNIRPIKTVPLMPPVMRVPELKPSAQLRPKAAFPIGPFAVPEDDPILLDLFELDKRARTPVGSDARPTNGNGSHGLTPIQAIASSTAPVKLPLIAPPNNGTASLTKSVEVATPSAEVVVFPSAGELQARVQRISRAVALDVPTDSSEASVASSRDFRFWRIASVAAGLAIAALVVGSNLSQAPPATRPRTAVPEAATPSPLRKASSRVLTKNKPAAAVQAKPAAMAVAESKPSHAAGVPATKNAGLHKGQPSRPAQVSHNDVIAKDTVVYFDRKGRPSSHKPLPDMSAKRSSESN